MKKRLVLVLAVILIVTLVLGACGNKGGSAPAASSGGGTSAPAASSNDGQKYDFLVNVTLGEPVSPNWARIFRELEERSDGQLVTTNNIYWGGSLIPIPEIPKGLVTGAATFSNIPTPNYTDILPLSCRIVQIPFIGLQDPVDSAEIWMQICDEFQEVRDELASFGIIALGATTLGIYGMHFIDKNELFLPEDLNGRKMVPYNNAMLPCFNKYGASSKYTPPGQIWEELNGGIVDGVVNNWAFQGWFGLTELFNQHVDFGEWGMFQEFNILGINADFYNSLPADLQQLIMDIFRNEKGYAAMWDDTAAMVVDERGKAAAKGDIINMLTPEQLAVWKGEIEPVYREVLDEINAQRGDTIADDIYLRVKEIIAEKYGK